MNVSLKAAVDLERLAEQVWNSKLQEPFLRHNSGLDVDRIPAGTLEEAQDEASRAARLLVELDGIDLTGLDLTQRLTAGFLRNDLRTWSEMVQSWQFQSAAAPYSTMLLSYNAQQIIAPLSNADPARALSLWNDLAKAARTNGERASAQAAAGRRLARPAIAGAVAGLKGQRSLVEHLMLSAAWTAQDRDRAERLCQAVVLPAYDAWIASIASSDYAEAASDDVGLVSWPGGEEEYQRLVRQHLTTDVSPTALHELGHSQVHEITERMAELRSRIGFKGSEQEFHASLASDSRLYCKTPAELEQRYRHCMARIEPLLPAWFGRVPRSPAAVARLPEAVEAGMTYGYYDRPQRVGDPGTYLYNGSGLDKRSQLQAAPLIYHELSPGHHFHIARQMELTDLPAVRRNSIELSVFNEGWAEYASGLAGEMGLYDDPYDMYGRLIHERFASQRLVIDTGMNAFGWSLDRARAFMRANTLEGDTQIASETLRYSTDLPAQALAYRFGNLAFLRLREQARDRLGPAFDVRDFHEAILSQGALPLQVLEQSLNEVLP